MLAHELINPLAPIRTGLELIRHGGDTVVAVERVRGMMERQVGHMVRLIDDLLDVSRITSGKIVIQREPTLLGTVVRSALEANRAAMAAKRIDVRVELPEDDCVIDVDPTRFVQILSNLLHNAAKFTNHDGSVRISATITQPRAMSCGRCRFRSSIQESGFRRSSCLVYLRTRYAKILVKAASSAGFVRCASNPARVAFSLSCSCPNPVSATSRTSLPST